MVHETPLAAVDVVHYIPGMASPQFPEPPASIPATPLDEVDRRVARVAGKKDEWTKVTIPQRIQYLRRCLEGVMAASQRWVQDGCRLKGIRPGDVLEGEEWLAGPMTTARNIRLLIQALEAGGQPTPPAVRKRADGQVVATVFPATVQDKLMFSGFTAEVWIEPGKPASQGAIYRNGLKGAGKVSLILGAGNVSSIPPMDALYKLFVENEVVVLKMNPVNEHVGAKLEEAFESLIDDGYMTIVYGGAAVGAHLANHPQIDTLHVTGSDRTYDAIVWGSDPEERARRKAADDPVNRRPFSAELGCVTPVVVVPGPWSDSDLEFQARHVAGMVAQNASFNCNAAKVLVVSRDWNRRAAFLERVEHALRATPPRKAYYPGAKDRWSAFLDKYPQARKLGADADGTVPWTIIPDVPPREGEYALSNEAFCGVLAVTALEGADARTFLGEAVKFVNDRCWGTLSMAMLVDPATEKAYRDEVDRATAELRYGGIGINCWPGIIYGLCATTWGAFPGHSPKDIQSGSGVVHNTYLFDHPQKSVVKAPFRIKPTPAWFADHKNLRDLASKLTEMEAAPSWGKLVKVAFAAFKG
jgi:acyl-CoA reductase-like NAD-dependent aldehyde dehydrogenase